MANDPKAVSLGRGPADSGVFTWHTLDAPVVAGKLGVDVGRGLSEEEVRHRAARIGKNLAGAMLIILGAVMALPGVSGPGLLVALAGIMLTDIPGKRRLERWVLSHPGGLARINRLRERFGKPPMFLEKHSQ